jgi:hypothetical protein
MYDDDPNLAAEQRLALQGARMRAEVAQVVPDRELAAKIAQQVVEAFARGMAQGEANRAAAADEPESEPEGVFATIRTIRPGDERARQLRWID